MPEEGGRLLWRGFSTTEMTYKSAVMYADHPWSMTVYGPTREATTPGTSAIGCAPPGRSAPRRTEG